MSTMSDRLNIAGIGIGGMGRNNLQRMETENIVALCDVDRDYVAPVLERYPNVPVYSDYRRLLEERDDIDAVMIATPDHTHAVIAMAAMLRGKHVYCQKPLTLDIREARTLARTAAQTGVVTQMGIQGHSGAGARRICEWIRGGAIGEVHEVDAWCTMSCYPHGHAGWSAPLARRPEKGQPVPAGLDWDLWLGPAEFTPYHRCYHPNCWRTWWDFGSGMMGDRGVHTLDPVVWALELGLPTSVEASSTGLNSDTHPVSSLVTFRFPSRDGMPPVKVTWYDGFRPPRPDELPDGQPMGHEEGGVMFRGEKGKILGEVYGENPVLIPAVRFDEARNIPETIPRIDGDTDGHEQEWIRCCKSGALPDAHFGYSAGLTEIAILGNIARRVDGRIDWDAENMKVTNLPEANRFVGRAYREGWSLES